MDAREALHRLFGFEDCRPGQAEAVGAAFADRDALVVMPAGAGKSLCYQLPALMREDLMIVVSAGWTSCSRTGGCTRPGVASPSSAPHEAADRMNLRAA